MSVWKRKAMECLPDKKKKFEQKDLSIHEVFSELLAATILAHRENDQEQLQKYYDFAAWCFQQKDKKLWNAAGVSFYEHLGDQHETAITMPRWVRKEIYIQIRALLGARLDKEIMDSIDRLYKNGMT